MFSDFNPIVRKLETMMLLSKEERHAVDHLPLRTMVVGPHQHLLREGDRPLSSMIVLEGIVSTSKIVGDGRRQITALHVPGDIPDLQSLHLRLLDHDVVTITSAKVGNIDHSALRDLCARFSRLNAALWRITLVDAAVSREWIANIGQRPAQTKIAHLFCEIMLRMQAVGLAADGQCELRLTQTEISDCIGMSIVHVNRSLQQLRKSGTMSFEKGVLAIHDWAALKSVADFDESYLHLDPREARAA